jgi:hypothetical protein
VITTSAPSARVPSCRLQTDACASADHDDGLAKQFRFPNHDTEVVAVINFSLDIAVSA